jgi:D-glycero-D-manno-heptose 1,7-bisphosphate phosphatase
MVKLMLTVKKFIFLDRDGVLNKKLKKGKYVTKLSEIKWRKGSLEALKILKDNGFKTIIATNQAGIGHGIMSKKEVKKIHTNMSKQVKKAGGSLDYIYVCPHHPGEKCICRKPMTGLFHEAQADLNLDFSKMYFIGDQISDKKAAKKLKLKYLHIKPRERLHKKIIKILKKYN